MYGCALHGAGGQDECIALASPSAAEPRPACCQLHPNDPLSPCTLPCILTADPLPIRPPFHCSAGDAAATPGAAKEAAASRSKRTPGDISFDALLLLLSGVRSFYTAVAKSMHTPARRREDPNMSPSAAMKAAALNLALVLKGNLAQELPELGSAAAAAASPAAAAAAAAAAAGAGSAEAADMGAAAAAGSQAAAAGPSDGAGGGSSSSGSDIGRVRARVGHLMRLIEELHAVLFDTRRHYCHLLVLNYFTLLGGMDSLAQRFGDAVELLWAVSDWQAAQAVAAIAAAGGSSSSIAAAATGSDAAAAGGDVAMTEAGSVGAGAVSGSGALESVEGGSGSGKSSWLKAPKVIVEACLLRMLTAFDLLSNAALLFTSPQVWLRAQGCGAASTCI